MKIDAKVCLPPIPAGEFKALAAQGAALADALRDADIVPQLLIHAQLTVDLSLVEEAAPYIEGAWSFLEKIPTDLRGRITARLIETIQSYADADKAWSGDIDTDVLRRIMGAGISRVITDEYVSLALEELGGGARDLRSVSISSQRKIAAANGTVAIVGAGMSGICMAIKLKEAGIDFVIFEKNKAAGGTWYENSYPGAGVDVPSHYYSYSFEPNPNWSYHFAKRDELYAYLENCVDKYGIRDHIRFNTELTHAEYDEDEKLWNVHVAWPGGRTETESYRFFICGVGQLNRPKMPRIEGMDAFKGPLFHTAEWDHAQDLTGKRVALIGTGASSMQVGPAIAGQVDKLLVFQRSPCWVAYNANYLVPVTDGMKWALANVPYFSKWHRYLLSWASGDGLHASLQVDPNWSMPDVSLNADNEKMRQNLIAHIKSELTDRPDLIDKVMPNYPPYGKRMLRDNNWYKLLKRDNVELINLAVERLTETGIVDGDGVEHPVDAIVMATGFQTNRILWPMEIVGRKGVSVRSRWGEDDPRAYLGVTVPEFPNMFILFGPNTNLSHGGSLFFHAECQVRYVMHCLREIIDRGSIEMECRQDVFEAYNERVDDAHSRMVWSHPAMSSWYKNAAGRVVANSPWRVVDYWALTKTVKADDYHFT